MVPFVFLLTRIRTICYGRAELKKCAHALKITAYIFAVSEPHSCFLVAKNCQKFSTNMKSQLGAKVECL